MTSLGQKETIPPQPPTTDMAYRNFVGTCRSLATREIYRRALQYFLSHLRLEPNDYVKLLEMDTKIAQMNICNYISYLRSQKGLASQTVTAYVSAVRKFYVMNDVQLNWEKIHSFKGEEEKRAEDRPYTHSEIFTMLLKTSRDIVQTFLDVKSDKKSTSLEAILIPVIIDLVEQKGNQILSSEIWNFVKENLEGETNPYDPNGYHVSGYTLYRNTITKLLEDKFGASYTRTKSGGKILFDKDKLRKVQKSYDGKAIVRTKPKGEGGESGEGILEKASEKIEDNIAQNEAQNSVKTPRALSQEPSLPSPSAKLSEEEKAEARAKYDAARERIRKKLSYR